MNIDLNSALTPGLQAEGAERGEERRNAGKAESAKTAGETDFLDVLSSVTVIDVAPIDNATGVNSLVHRQADGGISKPETNGLVDVAYQMTQFAGDLIQLASVNGLENSSAISAKDFNLNRTYRDEGGLLGPSLGSSNVAKSLVTNEPSAGLLEQIGTAHNESLSDAPSIHELTGQRSFHANRSYFADAIAEPKERELNNVGNLTNNDKTQFEKTAADFFSTLKTAEKFPVSDIQMSLPSHGGAVLDLTARAGDDISVSSEVTLTFQPVYSDSASHDQVAYWIGSDAQNAEMTIRVPGSDSIGVSISLEGKSADVVFRTDEVATRNMIEGSSNHLREMLSQQGMTLAGFTVGSGGDRARGGKDDKPRQHSDRKVESTQLASVVQKRLIVGSVGTALDLFV